jgi:hypothetical protein
LQAVKVGVIHFQRQVIALLIGAERYYRPKEQGYTPAVGYIVSVITWGRLK